MKSGKFKILICIVSVFLLNSCSKNNAIVFNPADDEAVQPRVYWALIKDPYVAIRSECDFTSEVLDHARRGDIFELKGKKITEQITDDKDKLKITWYEFDGGWVDASGIVLYDNKLKAENASKKLENN